MVYPALTVITQFSAYDTCDQISQKSENSLQRA